MAVFRAADRNQDALTGYRKTQGNWVVEIGGRMPRIEVAGDICWRRSRPTQGYRAEDDDDVQGLLSALQQELCRVLQVVIAVNTFTTEHCSCDSPDLSFSFGCLCQSMFGLVNEFSVWH